MTSKPVFDFELFSKVDRLTRAKLPEWREFIRNLVLKLSHDPLAYKKLGIGKLSNNFQIVDDTPIYFDQYGDSREYIEYIVNMPGKEFLLDITDWLNEGKEIDLSGIELSTREKEILKRGLNQYYDK